MRYSKTYKKSISGLSILEAIVSTAIVGIGFIAILQMTNYSVQSIDNSGDRTKANFLTSMLVEDVIGHRDTTYNNKSLIENFSENPWQATLNCGGGSTNQNIKNNIYDAQKNSAYKNKDEKWKTIINQNRFLKCKNDSETKKFQVFKVCNWSGSECENQSVGYNVKDYPMYIGRVEMKLNRGKKRKFIYFQADYKMRD